LRREQKVWSEVLLAVPPTLLTIANEVIESGWPTSGLPLEQSFLVGRLRGTIAELLRKIACCHL